MKPSPQIVVEGAGLESDVEGERERERDASENVIMYTLSLQFNVCVCFRSNAHSNGGVQFHSLSLQCSRPHTASGGKLSMPHTQHHVCTCAYVQCVIK